jgi:hypothetical protein
MASTPDRRTDPFRADSDPLTITLFVLLCEYARLRMTVTSQQLMARLFAPPMRLSGVESSPAGNVAELQVALSRVTEVSLERLGVNVSALVVTAKTNRPGGRHDADDPSGFYLPMARHGYDVTDPDKLVLDEQGRVYAAFA